MDRVSGIRRKMGLGEFYSALGEFRFEKLSNMPKIWQKMKKSFVQLPDPPNTNLSRVLVQFLQS